MVIKKQDFGEDEITIFDEAIVYKRGDYWQFRLWLRKEGKYVRRSLGTRNRTTAIEKGKELYLELLANLKQGKTYFSIDAKRAVDLYVEHRRKDVDAALIVPGRLATIRAHLKNWLDFIGRDTKLKEMERTDCEGYFHFRVKGVGRTAARQVTVQNEQSTINAMMDWLFKRGEARIDGFDFRKLPRIDTRDDAIRRATFYDEEIAAIHQAIDGYCDRERHGLDEREWLMRCTAGQFFRMAAMSGLRIGELMQLTWHDVWWRGHWSKRQEKLINLVNVTVRASTSKVRKSRELYFKDDGYLRDWRDTVASRWSDESEKGKLIFAPDGRTLITKRALYYHFDKVLELAGITRVDRDLVPYSFRHYFITERITAGLSYQQVAEMCGTSVAQIERTYSRVTEDIIGECYIYLISRFASDAGKKAGEFYTPAAVSRLLAKLAAPKPGNTICDPACGSGSLLIRAAEEVGSDNFALYGQEVNGATWALARMNMFLHSKDAARIEWCDTLNSPTLIEGDHLMRFDVVVANPPFSLDKWGAENAATDQYNRFWRGIPPKSKGDYGFLTHMIEIAKRHSGRVAVIVPHGVLFRGGSEGAIRKALIEENLLDAVVGLPSNLFTTTGIPVAILIFDRSREQGGPNEDCKDVLFIDASKDFTPGKTQNVMEDAHIARVLDTYAQRSNIARYSHRADVAEITENDFNLNIPRYVDTFEAEEEIDVAALQRDINRIEQELAEVRGKIAGYLRELGVDA